MQLPKPYPNKPCHIRQIDIQPNHPMLAHPGSISFVRSKMGRLSRRSYELNSSLRERRAWAISERLYAWTGAHRHYGQRYLGQTVTTVLRESSTDEC